MIPPLEAVFGDPLGELPVLACFPGPDVGCLVGQLLALRWMWPLAPAPLPVAFAVLVPPLAVLAVWTEPGDDDVLAVLVPLAEPPPGACRWMWPLAAVFGDPLGELPVLACFPGPDVGCLVGHMPAALPFAVVVDCPCEVGWDG